MTAEPDLRDTAHWGRLAPDASLERTAAALMANGMRATVVPEGETAKRAVLALLPDGATVMNVTSTTLDQIGLSKEIEAATRFEPIRNRLQALPQSEQRLQMRRLLAAVDVVVGSVHAVTEDGQVLVASNSGSQLGPYVFGAGKVIWIIGGQKVVGSVDEGLRRLREHSFVLEDERMHKAFGRGSAINKVLLVSREIVPERVQVFLVRQVLGF